MNPQGLFNAQYGTAYILPTNIEYAAAEQQTQQPNTTLIQIYQPQVTYQTIQQVYQPNVQYHVNHQTYQPFAVYQANDQFYQPNVGLNMETRLSTLLPQEQYAAAEQQTQQPNITQNLVYQPQAAYQPILQIYQPNVAPHDVVSPEICQSNTEYQANDQFQQPNVDLNIEKILPTALPQKEQEKRNRTKYTDQQIKYLEYHFKMNPYVTLRTKMELSTTLGIEEYQIKKWYQNRRNKENTIKRKAQSLEEYENQSQNIWFPSPIESHGSKFHNELTGQSSANIAANQHINFGQDYFTGNAYQHNFYPQARSQEVFFNANGTQNIDGSHVLGPQSSNNNYAYSNPGFFGNNNLGLTPVGILGTLTPLQGNILVAPLQGNVLLTPLQNNQNILNNNYYYSNTNSIENLTPTVALMPSSQLENLTPSTTSQEDH